MTNPNGNGNSHRSPDAEAEDILIVPADRVVLKSTTCANCIGFDTGEEVLRRWSKEPNTIAEVRATIAKIHNSGLQLRTFQDGKAARAVSRLMSMGMTQEQALLKFEQDKILQARAMVDPGADWAWADIRMEPFHDITNGMKSGSRGLCSAGGVRPDGSEIGPLQPVWSAFHCHKWCGRTGWSLAHNPDRKLDPLPAELTEIADSKAKPDKA